MILDSDELKLPPCTVTVRYKTHGGHFTVHLQRFVPTTTKETWGQYLRILKTEWDTGEQVRQVREWLDSARRLMDAYAHEADMQYADQHLDNPPRGQTLKNRVLEVRYRALLRQKEKLEARYDQFMQMLGG